MPVRSRPGIPVKPDERQGGGSPASQNGDGTASAEKIGQSIAYMNQHLDAPLQVSTLTALAGVSPSHFFTLFKRVTGHTPIDFFIHLRMRRACELLEGTSLNVKEVAASLGYDDQFYFSRVFKSVNHVAPSEYRVRLAGSGRTKRAAVLTSLEKRNLEESLPRLPAL
ncbi:MAG: AraC family transcriptional regulator [Verrucomicrobiota bacterium]